jgi:hypothetical protein
MASNETSSVKFEKSGFFGGINYDIKGHIRNSNGKEIVKLKGEWNGSCSCEWLAEAEGFKKGQAIELWKAEPQDYKGQPYRLTKFANSLNSFPPELKSIVLPTDSRRRLDRFYLERGFSEYATDWKKVGEYRQREDHKLRGHTNTPKTELRSPRGDQPTRLTSSASLLFTSTASQTSKQQLSKDEKRKLKKDRKAETEDEKKDRKALKEKKGHAEAKDQHWTPIWFVQEKDHDGKPIWHFSNQYWAIRQERETKVKNNEELGELHTHPSIKSTAADYATYFENWEALLGKQTEDANDKEKAEKYKRGLQASASK